ncbi:hypothetical protein [Nostoc sp. FACHB-110]|uniref:hypothetical protein n=1 Tax=Nostoc sp. FACHB-110 TaxID=2692834 RepID=UPI001688CDF3|nr:hypothetical protein [Nostoc sp. FACHB-110]MBD2435826.1 hypothetical protein [Nostoc sp. FACHB-110]
MVNTGTTTTTTVLKSDTPEIVISLSTFTSVDTISINGVGTNTGSRFCSFEITITGVKIPLAHSTFSRVFDYVMNLANNDINPIPGLNTNPIANLVNTFGATPKGLCNIQIDKTELVPTASLVLSSENLRLDYMDEFFNRTLTYLTSAISQDLNPDE